MSLNIPNIYYIKMYQNTQMLITCDWLQDPQGKLKKSSKMHSQARHFINSAWESVLEGLSGLNGSRCSAHGANIILCSGSYRVAIHEVLVRRFTNIFNWLPITADVLDSMRDENNKMVVILPGLVTKTIFTCSIFYNAIGQSKALKLQNLGEIKCALCLMA